MAWTDEEWVMFVAVINDGFAAREPLTDGELTTYRLLLDAIEPDAAVRALQELVLEGQALRPKPGEIAKRCRADVSAPTYEEAERLIYGRGGILRARPPRNGPIITPEQFAEARRQRAREVHPLVGAFYDRLGYEQLRDWFMGGEDADEYASLRRKELRAAWDRHAEAFAGRDIEALAAGRTTGGELKRLDPLDVLGVPATAAAALPTPDEEDQRNGA